MITRGDDNSETVAINFNFKYYSRTFSSMIIYTNGYVQFASSSNAINALPYDLDTRYGGGGIYYQNLNSQSSDFNSIKSDFNRLNYNFVPTNLFRITYDNVPNYVGGGSLGSLRASFQIVLASDGSKSYVLLKYSSCLASYSTFSPTPGLYYQDENGAAQSVTLTSPCNLSNVNLVGTWVYDVTPVLSKCRIEDKSERVYFFNL
jgi:hypothetical protein